MRLHLTHFVSRNSISLPRLATPLAAGFAIANWCAFLFLYGLGAGPLYRTESLRAIIGAECLRGHWLYPVLYGEPFLTKPPGHYAAIAFCSIPFGAVTDWSARIPSALAATVSVFLLWGMLRRAFGERPAFLAALLIPTSVLWLDKVPSAEIDMTLAGWVAAAMVLFHRAIRNPNRPSTPLLIGALACVAGGFLTKWTAPAFFYLAVVPLLAWRGRLQLLFGWRHLLAATLAVGVVACWAAAVANEVGWENLRDTIRSEALYRFHPPAKAKSYSWSGAVAFPLIVLAAHLPLAFFAFRTARPAFLQRLDDSQKLIVQLLHCWVWPNLLFWSLVPNHNVRYILPLSPALMALGALGAIRGRMGNPPEAPTPDRVVPGWRSRLPKGFLLLLAGWAVAKITFVVVAIPLRSAGRDAAATAAELRALVPPGELLYLSRLKDEGVMFYYGRPARKVHDWEQLPPGAFAAMILQEWQAIPRNGHFQLVRWMYDQQGDPLILIHKGPR